MFKVVVTDYTYENLDIERKILARPDIELKDYQYRDAAHVKEITADCDVLVTQYAGINREVIENLAHCRMIIRYAIGVDNIDLAAASERGIPVVNVPDYGIDEVSTYAVTLLLCAARKIPQTIDMIRRAEWNYAITKPMYRTAGKTVGLIGFGRIPRAVAKKLSGFDMQILAYDPVQIRQGLFCAAGQFMHGFAHFSFILRCGIDHGRAHSQPHRCNGSCGSHIHPASSFPPSQS